MKKINLDLINLINDIENKNGDLVNKVYKKISKLFLDLNKDIKLKPFNCENIIKFLKIKLFKMK